MPQGVRPRTEAKYAPAIKLLRKRPELPVRMSRKKWEAYQQAAQEWRQSKEPLKHVAERHGLRDVRLREFLRRIGETV